MAFFKTGVVKQKGIKAIGDSNEFLKVAKKMELSKKKGKQIKIEEPKVK